jgi:fluoride exporter
MPDGRAAVGTDRGQHRCVWLVDAGGLGLVEPPVKLLNGVSGKVIEVEASGLQSAPQGVEVGMGARRPGTSRINEHGLKSSTATPTTRVPGVAHPPRLLPLVGAAGAIGASLRLAVLGAGGLSDAGSSVLAPRTMVALLVLNVTGSLVAGGAIEAARRGRWPARRTEAVVVGFCGGLTTFSTVTVEVARRLTEGGSGPALAYLLVSVGASVAAVLAGRWAVSRWTTRADGPTGVTS